MTSYLSNSKKIDDIFPGLTEFMDNYNPTRKELLAEGMALDENGLDMTAPFYGKKHTAVGRKMCGNNPQSGEDHWNYGKTASAETKKKMSGPRGPRKVNQAKRDEWRENISRAQKARWAQLKNK